MRKGPLENVEIGGSDLLALQTALTDLYSEVGRTTLADRTLKFTNEIIPSHLIFFDQWGSDGGYLGTSWTNSAKVPPPDKIEIFHRYAHENPVYVEVVVKKRPDPVILTDFLSTKQYQESNIYKQYYSVLDVNYQMGVALWVSADLVLTCLLIRKDMNFTERDRSMLSVAAPHLINVVRNATDFDSLTSALEVKNSGMLTADGNGKILSTSPFCSQVLKKYFSDEMRDDGQLPESIFDSFNIGGTADRKSAFKIKNSHGELSIREVKNELLEKALLFEEKRTVTAAPLESLNLTKREAEILFWISQGKSDGDIGSICAISKHTVSKHAQNIYIKLGVETRTAAMLRAIEIL